MLTVSPEQILEQRGVRKLPPMPMDYNESSPPPRDYAPEYGEMIEVDTQGESEPPPIDADPYGSRGKGSTDAAVINPRAPYDIARLFQAQRAAPTLHHRGCFYEWDGSSWPEAGEDKLRAQLYAFLDGCQCKVKVKEEDEFRSVKPNAAMVAGVLDALRAAAHLDATIEPPAWLDGVVGSPAHEVSGASETVQ